MKKILCKVSVVIILIIVLISAVACSSASDNYNGAPGSAPSIGGDYEFIGHGKLMERPTIA